MKKFIICIILCFTLINSKRFTITNAYPHDFSCYTQGFQFINSTTLLESCGLYNQSKIHYLTLDNQTKLFKNVKQQNLPAQVFGEGSTKFKDYIYVLTWRERKVFKMDQNFNIVKTMYWNSQGWGLTHDQQKLYVSDGSNIIYVVNQKFQILRKINVRFKNGKNANYLNELQFFQGKLLANIYMDKRIVLINLQTGIVQQELDTDQIHRQQQSTENKMRRGDVINGIAYDAQNKKLLLTGKLWRQIYEVVIE